MRLHCSAPWRAGSRFEKGIRMEKLSNPQQTIAVIKKYGFDFKKQFGQNFLIDAHVLEKIIATAEITKEDYVVEIGRASCRERV